MQAWTGIVVAGLILVLSGSVGPTFRGSVSRPAIDLGQARSRLDLAVRLRVEPGPWTPEAGERFDAVIGSLRTGLGTDAPVELAPWLATIERSRECERNNRQGLISEPGVAEGLVGASRTLDYLNASAAPRHGPSQSVSVWPALVLAGMILIAIASVLAVRQRRRHVSDVARLTALMGLPAGSNMAVMLDSIAAMSIRSAAKTAPRGATPPNPDPTPPEPVPSAGITNSGHMLGGRSTGKLFDVTPLLDADL